MTERAARQILRIAGDGERRQALRVAVNGGGCSGFQYEFKLTSDRAADDIVLERDGATVLVDPVSLIYMSGAELDFVDDLIGQAFKISNPNARASCGCGTSFSI